MQTDNGGKPKAAWTAIHLKKRTKTSKRPSSGAETAFHQNNGNEWIDVFPNATNLSPSTIWKPEEVQTILQADGTTDFHNLRHFGPHFQLLARFGYQYDWPFRIG